MNVFSIKEQHLTLYKLQTQSWEGMCIECVFYPAKIMDDTITDFGMSVIYLWICGFAYLWSYLGSVHTLTSFQAVCPCMLDIIHIPVLRKKNDMTMAQNG